MLSPRLATISGTWARSLMRRLPAMSVVSFLLEVVNERGCRLQRAGCRRGSADARRCRLAIHSRPPPGGDRGGAVQADARASAADVTGAGTLATSTSTREAVDRVLPRMI